MWRWGVNCWVGMWYGTMGVLHCTVQCKVEMCRACTVLYCWVGRAGWVYCMYGKDRNVGVYCWVGRGWEGCELYCKIRRVEPMTVYTGGLWYNILIIYVLTIELLHITKTLWQLSLLFRGNINKFTHSLLTSFIHPFLSFLQCILTFSTFYFIFSRPILSCLRTTLFSTSYFIFK